MNCPHCDSSASHVHETRRHEGSIYRRRQCHGCGQNYISHEVATKLDVLPVTLRQQLNRAKTERRQRQKDITVNLTRLPW